VIHRLPDGTTNHQSSLLFEAKERIKSDFSSKRRGQSIKSVCLLHDYTQSVALTWRQAILPLRSAQRGPRRKRFRADDKVKLSVQRWPDEKQQTVFERTIMKLPQRWRWFTDIQGGYIEETGITFEKDS
jgi:hypothetical protein